MDSVSGEQSASTASPVVRHRVIIRDVRGRILIDASNGAPRLPSFTSEDRHTGDVDYINAALCDRFGVRAVVLRGLSHSEPVDGIVERAHELELLDGVTGTLRAVDADHVEFAYPADRAALADWRAAPAGVIDGRGWTQPGWFVAATTWIERAMHDAGLGAPRQIRQLRAWPSSCVLVVETDGAPCYFKALPLGGQVEFAVTRYLAKQAAEVAPRLIAVDEARRWLLMAACSGAVLERITDIAAWERAAARFAALQVDCIGRVGDLTALGCPTRDLTALAQSIAWLAADPSALRVGLPGGLTPDEAERFCATVPALQRRCADLEACGIPLTLDHGDLWPGNVFVDAASCSIIDWEDAAVAPPFLGLAPLTVGMVQAGLGTLDRVQRVNVAHLRAFEAIAPTDRLRRAAELAAPLCFVEMAARYRSQRASIVPLHPWMRDLVPHALRLALNVLV